MKAFPSLLWEVTNTITMKITGKEAIVLKEFLKVYREIMQRKKKLQIRDPKEPFKEGQIVTPPWAPLV